MTRQRTAAAMSSANVENRASAAVSRLHIPGQLKNCYGGFVNPTSDARSAVMSRIFRSSGISDGYDTKPLSTTSTLDAEYPSSSCFTLGIAESNPETFHRHCSR